MSATKTVSRKSSRTAKIAEKAAAERAELNAKYAAERVEKAAAEAAESAIEGAAFVASTAAPEETANPKRKGKVIKPNLTEEEKATEDRLARKVVKLGKGKAKEAAAPAAGGAAKLESNGHAGAPKKEGPRTPQIRIMEALERHGNLTRKQIAEKGPVDAAGCTEWIGSLKADVRAANDVKHFPSLIGLGYVRHEVIDHDGKDVVLYSLTPKGKKALEKIKKAAE